MRIRGLFIAVGIALTGIAFGVTLNNSETTHTHVVVKVQGPADKACRKAAPADKGACIKLYNRPAFKGANISDPAGPALVAECFDQYRGEELHYCLTQPAN